MASTARIDELKKKFDENPRRYFAPLANEFRKAGEIEQAIMICEEFLPQQPGHMSGHIVYGQALFEANRMEESRTVFETALTLDPENLIALRHLGDIARGQGDLPAARRWYDRVLEADPRNDEMQGLIASLDDAPAAAASAPAASPQTAAPAPAATGAEERFAPPSRSSAPPALPEPIDLDLDADLSAGMPATVPLHPPSASEEQSSGLGALPGLEPTASPSFDAGRAEGLESVEFAPPRGPLDRAHDLGASFEAGEFTAPAAPVAPLAGLEETSMGAFERSEPAGPPPPDLPPPHRDVGQTVPPHGDPLAHAMPEVGPSTLEFAVPTATERAAARGRAETETMPALEPEGNSLPETRAEIPEELPPAVIAAEAELMDIGEPFEAPAAPRARAASSPQAPFVTETMAELFVKQGFHDQALDVYRQLLAAAPNDQRLQQRVAELQPSAPAAAGDSVRDFLAWIAMRRPGERTAASAPPSDDDFTSLGAATSPQTNHTPAPTPHVPPPMPQRAPAPVRSTPSGAMSSAVERAATTQGAGGSIDALFGNRAAGTSEDSAASALAQAFGGASEPAAQLTGRPARAAAGELSLDAVFRDGPPRPPRASQSFSFDQFFSENASGDRTPAPAPSPASEAPAPSEPAARSEDDIEQFNSWLQGLKPK